MSALTAAASPTGQQEESVAATSRTSREQIDAEEETNEDIDEDLAAAIEKFVSLDLEGGDGGDSDEEGDECVIHMTGMDHTSSSELNEGVELDPEDDRGEVKGLVKLTATGTGDQIGNMIIEEDDSSVVALEGFKIGNGKSDVWIPRVPKDFVPPKHNLSRNEPPFQAVDNPGNWPQFCFVPEYQGNNRSRSSKYKHHQLPTGAVPFPKREDGKRINPQGWEFFYNGWHNPAKPYRRGATTANMFPKEMDGCVDGELLAKLGLNKERMRSGDAAFFLQLILPFCDPSQSGVENDPRIPFFTEEERFTNMSKYESGRGGTYGHVWKATTAKELVNFHGITIRDGVKGSTNGAIHRRWMKERSTYDSEIASTMTLTRFGELKRSLKLCHNGSCPKRGQPGYDPAYKFDLIWRCMVANCNAITLRAEENLTVDETTYGHAGYGEAGSGITGRLRNKKVNKGGQTTVISDSRRFRPRAYIHRHNLHPMIEGMTKKGTNEMVHLLKMIEPMVVGSEGTAKKIFERKPLVVGDNFFFDDKSCEWIGKNGFAGLGTMARNALVKEIDRKNLHVEKHAPRDPRSKVARFLDPIVAVKNSDGYQRVHVSFQSTSSTNITTVNCLNECKLFVEIRERGKGQNKRYWGIEMNDARRLYLSMYCTIDVADHLLKNAAIYYRTWKYWHASMNHCFALVIVLAYGIYEECCEGDANEEWKIEKKIG